MYAFELMGVSPMMRHELERDLKQSLCRVDQLRDSFCGDFGSLRYQHQENADWDSTRLEVLPG